MATKAKGLGRKLLAEVATIVAPETLLACHRKVVAQKYDGSAKRGPLGSPKKIMRVDPRTLGEIEALINDREPLGVLVFWTSKHTALEVVFNDRKDPLTFGSVI